MAERVDPLMRTPQAPIGEPPLDPVGVHPGIEQLLTGDQAVLGVGKLGDIVSDWSYIALKLTGTSVSPPLRARYRP
jgi:hypothetical protein